MALPEDPRRLQEALQQALNRLGALERAAANSQQEQQALQARLAAAEQARAATVPIGGAVGGAAAAQQTLYLLSQYRTREVVETLTQLLLSYALPLKSAPPA